MSKLKDINWNHLYCFYEVAKAQSLKKGASEMGVASSTLSAQIKMLEEKFETTFFHRSSKGLNLTKEGVKFYEKTKTIFEEGSKLLEFFYSDSVGGYPVLIGIEDTMSNDVAAEFASQYWDVYTNYGTVNTVRQLDHTSLINNLNEGNIDWGITLRKPSVKNISYEKIGSFEMVFCCSFELYEKFKDVKDILVNIPLVESKYDKNLNQFMLDYLRKNEVMPKEKIYSDHIDFIHKLCARGRCVMYLPKNPLNDYKGLKTFQLDTPLTLTLYAVWRQENEGLISIKKLQELVQKKLTTLPARYQDVDLQIEVSDVSDELLE